ncbi:NAD(P)/FAD-dependent oxidoreductase [Citreimonas salinaria]|uniref:Dehydrogenase (Flavoprotein) n=1 Tax=Citreimonas salinaria TaxID=321339 RepID=A0A1H3NV04_9RHOB|nr:NAD(P)/FAD-dependent oxidoreductase [Citreimonas salinaria]SDY92523.1 Dehydrogenase (flavoprotein) [Citreimonas salinaria]
MTHDAIVIGGGPSGTSAAIGLARKGWHVALVERAEFPRRKVCGEFMSAANRPVLEALGVCAEWDAAAGPAIGRVALFMGERVVTAPMPATGGSGRGLGRDVLDPLLLEQARCCGVEVLQPGRATGFTRKGAGHRVELAMPQGTATLEAPVLVAAHGSWERGPLPTQAPKLSAPGDLLGFKAHFRGGHLDADLMPLLSFPGGYGGMVQVDGGRLSLSCCIRRDVLEDLRRPGDTAGAALQAYLMRSCRGIRETLDGAKLSGPWLGAGPIRPDLRPCYADGIFRVGNLAGEAHPVIAEGISMAIQSGWLLSRAFEECDSVDRKARDRAGARYQAMWRRQFSTRIRAANAFANLAMRPERFAGLGRLISTVPATLTLGAWLSGKVKPVR